MSFTSKTELKKALGSSKTSWSQRGGQTAKNILKEAPGHKMSAYETKKFLKESGMSKSGIKDVMGSLQQPATAKPEKKVWEKPQMREAQKQQPREIQKQQPQQPQQPQSGSIKTPEWVEKVENPGEQAPQKAFGQRIEEDVRLEKAGQMQSGPTRQPSSDVDRSRYSQEDVDRLEKKGQTDYYNKALQTDTFDKLNKAEDVNAAKIDAMLGGGGGEEGGGGSEK